MSADGYRPFESLTGTIRPVRLQFDLVNPWPGLHELSRLCQRTWFLDVWIQWDTVDHFKLDRSWHGDLAIFNCGSYGK